MEAFQKPTSNTEVIALLKAMWEALQKLQAEVLAMQAKAKKSKSLIEFEEEGEDNG